MPWHLRNYATSIVESGIKTRTLRQLLQRMIRVPLKKCIFSDDIQLWFQLSGKNAYAATFTQAAYGVKILEIRLRCPAGEDFLNTISAN